MTTRRAGAGAIAAVCAATALATMAAAPSASAQSSPRVKHAREFDLQAHRGGVGLRPESTLASFGNALQLGVSTLELDVQITEDGQAVVTHDRKVNGVVCQDTGPASVGDPEFPYVGKYVNTLTLAQVKTLDCGTRRPKDPATDPFVATMEMVPGTRMPTLREVFDLVHRYDADDVTINVETKVEAGAPSETAPREQFVQVVAAEIRAARIAKQITIQSFDWGSLMRMRQVYPQLPLVALTNIDFLEVGKPGASAWLGGIDIDDFGGDPIAAIASFGATSFSPVAGTPQDGKVGDPGYVPYVTQALVDHAHASGIKVIPWTVDDVPTMQSLIDLGVDGLITDYPDRLRALLAADGFRLPKAYSSPFDLQAHRGGRARLPENTLAAFRNALQDRDISTLETDTGITRDGVVVISHERAIPSTHCVDTAPATPGDPQFPYVGDLIRDLTLAQIKTLDCGSKTLPDLPQQQAVPGEHIPTLQELLDLVKTSGRDDVRLNIETKISPLVEDTVPFDVFTSKLLGVVLANGFGSRVTIQSFDWRTIQLAKKLAPQVETVALVWQYGPTECASLADECELEAVYGDPSVRSPWTGSLDYWDKEDLAKLVRASGASTVSANWQVHDPALGHIESSDWYAKEDPSYFFGTVADMHQRHLKVVPYTVDDEATMQRVIDLGVDGLITDDPWLLALVAKRNGLR